MAVITEATEADLPAVRELLLQYAKALPFSLDYQGFGAEQAALPRPYVRPDGLMLLAKDDAQLVGVCAYRRFAQDIAELKRTYVLPAARGGGTGRRLLEQAMTQARSAGYAAIRLDTHRPTMQAAMGLYRSLGFSEIAPYGPDLDGQLAFFEARLP